MAPTAILLHRAKSRPSAEVWLARALQARRIALSLSVKDADILEAYAVECEAEATRQAPAIAA